MLNETRCCLITKLTKGIVMKKIYNSFLYFTIYSFIVSNPVSGKTITEKQVITKTNSTLNDIFGSIDFCRWKNDAQTCLNLSFDDNNPSHRKISQIIDQYGYKATFFSISSYMYIDSLKDISARGHEIGNHTYSHLDLPTIDSTEADFEIRMSKEMIENMLGIKCLSFTEPYHDSSPLTRLQVYNYHEYDRDYSPYFNRNYYEQSSSTTIDDERTLIESGISSRNMIPLDGHGINGDGYEPITQDFLYQTLDLIKSYADNGDLWVATLKEGAQYENLYHELQFVKTLSGDTVRMNFKNYNKNKYRDDEQSPVSVVIPYTTDIDLNCLTDSATVQKFTGKYVITSDLKRDTSIVVIIKPLGITTQVSNPNADVMFGIFPNPVVDILNIKGAGVVSLVEIYNSEGQLQLRQTNNNTRIDVSRLVKGYYLIKIEGVNGSTTLVNRIQFLKI